MTTPGSGVIGDATIRVTADTTPAALALRGLTRDANGQLRDLRGRFVSETRLINNSLTTVTSGSDRFKAAIGGLRSAALLLSPALIPIAVQAAPIAAGVGAATAAIGAFGLAAAGQVTAITDAADAEKKYQDAVDEHGATSKEAAQAQTAYVRQIEKMPPATRTAAAALSSLKTQYQAWSDSLADDTMPVATKTLQALSAVFPKMTPLVQGASTQLDRFVTIAAGTFASPGFDALNARFAQFATGALARANDAIVHFLRTVDTGKISGGVSEFMDYVHANGPLVKDTLANVMQALSNVARAAANAGPGLLTLVNAFAGLVAAVPPGVITTLLQLSLALKAARIAAAALGAVTGAQATANLAAFVRSARFGGVAAAVSGVAQQMSTLQKVAGSLGVLAVVAVGIDELAKKARGAPPDVDKLASSLKALSVNGEFSGELKATFSDMDAFVSKVGKLRAESATLEKAKPLLAFSGIGSFADTALSKIDDLVRGTESLGASKDDLATFDEAFAQLVKSGDAKVAAQEFQQFDTALRKTGLSTAQITALFPQYTSAVADAADEQKLAAQSMGIFGAQAQQTSAKLEAQKLSADGLRQAVQALNDVNRSALGGMVGFEAAIDAAGKAAAENAGSLKMVNGQLNLNSPKAQAAATALNDLAAKTDAAASAARENGSSWSTVNGIYTRGRDKLIAAATQMGLTREEAKKLADQILKTPDKTARLRGNLEDLQAKLATAKQQLKSVPDSRRAQVRADISDLQYAVNRAKLALGQLRDRTVYINAHMYVTGTSQARAAVSTSGAGRVFEFATGGPVGFPAGGPVRGRGTGTSDSILARVSNGEYVIPARRVQQYGAAMFDDIRAGTLTTARPAAPSMASLGVGASRPAPAVNITHTYQIHFTNTGVLGSPFEVEDWLTRAIDNLHRTGRLPSAVRG
ncbi:hypothetical protein QA802_07980 [Streptomyces sp. B21-105]|uniref:hypothetical protein n=1 Tax=Streptomyces sp. B21-105 TaxID=3039417 RepID=UPI002FF2478C